MRRCYRWRLNASYEAPNPLSKMMPAKMSPPPKMKAMISKNRFVASHACCRLPDPPHTHKGMIRIMPAATAINSRISLNKAIPQ